MEAVGPEGSSSLRPPSLHSAARPACSRQVQGESPGLEQSQRRGSEPGRSPKEGEVDPEIRSDTQSWLKRADRSGRGAVKAGHFGAGER